MRITEALGFEDCQIFRTLSKKLFDMNLYLFILVDLAQFFCCVFKIYRMSSRRRPLHTCGVSFLTIAHNTCSRAQNVDGRLGSATRKMVRIAKLANPLIFVLQYQFLLFLSLIDDGLLATANIVEKIYPSSKLVFDKIDNLLPLIETFPSKFDDAVDELPCFNQDFLEWAVTLAISLLKFMINILMNWGRDGTGEKEILVDMNCNKGLNGSESADSSECCSEAAISSVSETQQAAMDEKMKSNAIKSTYKEILKMGTFKRAEEFSNDGKGTAKEVDDENDERQKAKMEEESVQKAEENEENSDQSYEENSEEKDEKEEAGLVESEYEEASSGSIENEDNILELFETAWLMKPPPKQEKGNLMPRSASFV